MEMAVASTPIQTDYTVIIIIDSLTRGCILTRNIPSIPPTLQTKVTQGTKKYSSMTTLTGFFDQFSFEDFGGYRRIFCGSARNF